ncbi:hypothetical protein TNCV_3293771 [Trichonephila clavipes]|nr:hypothetical protein TNCV_3293771 [Trichonephila clavipes]
MTRVLIERGHRTKGDGIRYGTRVPQPELQATMSGSRKTGATVRVFTSLSLPPTSREDLRLNGYLEYPIPQTHYTFISIHAFSGIRTQTYGTAVSVANHYTEWATNKNFHAMYKGL